MQVAAGALANELKVAYLSPAVYPPDTRVPVAAVARYWHQLRGATVEQSTRDLQILADAELLQLDRDSMSFHDLQHDYLALYAEDPPLLHADLLAAYWFFFVTLRMDGGSSLKSPISGITFLPSSRGWENHHNGSRPGLSNAADCDGWSACCADPTLPWPRLRNRTIFLASRVGPRA
jgi:hypothetical protein